MTAGNGDPLMGPRRTQDFSLADANGMDHFRGRSPYREQALRHDETAFSAVQLSAARHQQGVNQDAKRYGLLSVEGLPRLIEGLAQGTH